MQPQPRSSRNRKIEPLNFAEAAMAPALKGMTSFLDVTAEDVRNGTFESFGLREVKASKVEIRPVVVIDPGDETLSGYITSVANRRNPLTEVTSISSRWTAPDETKLEMVMPTEAYISVEPPRPPVYVSPPGGETYTLASTVVPRRESQSAQKDLITPGRGRSKVRKCVLAQDGHSLGEEAIYQVMWRLGRPENSDANGSRSIRIGAAEVGYKVNMAKKNVRQNISRLFEKLAVEIIEDFETMISQARLYRIYSYKQILERRRAVGMEYVLRNKGVLFCSANGELLVSSPAYVLTPGDETSLRPAPPKRRRRGLPLTTSLNYPPKPLTIPDTYSEDFDLQAVSQALNRYWPVDHGAAVQLLRDCRRVRPDVRPEEIVFFIREKLELARNNRSITNPTGLILATVPQSFAGKTFDEFRSRMDRQASLANEENRRKEEEQAELVKWLTAERDKCETIVGDASRTERERDSAERRLRELSSWNPQV